MEMQLEHNASVQTFTFLPLKRYTAATPRKAIKIKGQSNWVKEHHFMIYI